MIKMQNEPVLPDFDVAPDDPMVNYLQHAPYAVELERLHFDSPALTALRQAGIKLVVPLVSQGELVGMLKLGPRLGEQEYSSDDRNLLNNLATQATPAVRIAQLVAQQQAKARDLERWSQELRLARVIQQTLLPKQLPELDGWKLDVLYQPAREVAGDFYDFFQLPDGRLVITVGDVTDKGVPAAIVMATTRSILRGSTRRQLDPSAALERSNNLLCPEIPELMVVTCLYAILDPITGVLQYANAGHNLPILQRGNTVIELRATGMPLGIFPGTQYEQNQVTLEPGDRLLLYSDGLTEAHNRAGEMFGFPRLHALMTREPCYSSLIEFLVTQLYDFVGTNWEQEDDVTLMTLEYEGPSSEWKQIAHFSIASEPGNERAALEQLTNALQSLGLSAPKIERLKTAVAEATMNAIEYGNHNNPELFVRIRVLASPAAVKVRISDQGGKQEIPQPELPDLEAKLAGKQPPRGWGMFLIRNLVDEFQIIPKETHNIFELIMRREDSPNA